MGISEREVSRAVRWLTRHRWPLPLPREAGDLLAVRLASRRRLTVRAVAVLSAAVVVTMIWDLSRVVTATQSSDESVREGRLVVVFALYCLPPVLFAVAMRAAATADRVLARTLPDHVDRTGNPFVPAVLGRARTGVAAGIVVVGAISCWAVWATQPVAFATEVSGLLAVAGGFSVLGLRTVLNRPTVAFDALTLALDERLRSEEAGLACLLPAFPVLALLRVTSPGPGQTGWYPLAMICGPALIILLGAAAMRPPWKERRREAGATQVKVAPEDAAAGTDSTTAS